MGLSNEEKAYQRNPDDTDSLGSLAGNVKWSWYHHVSHVFDSIHSRLGFRYEFSFEWNNIVCAGSFANNALLNYFSNWKM